LYTVAADPLIWEQHPVRNRHEEAIFLSFFEESLASGGALVAVDVKSQQIIGSSRFHGYNEERSEVEIGWTFLARSHWGGSYNGEMKRLMLGHAFRFVRCVVFLVGLQNVRSQRAVERIGGVRVWTRPDAGGRDSYVYQITAAVPDHIYHSHFYTIGDGNERITEVSSALDGRQTWAAHSRSVPHALAGGFSC
jgi:RimJ/RimL family protein N-acetyltransferase